MLIIRYSVTSHPNSGSALLHRRNMTAVGRSVDLNSMKAAEREQLWRTRLLTKVDAGSRSDH
eukprot:COSAG06_NODE_38940_length_418_cov_0.514107_1_plen_61_part_01